MSEIHISGYERMFREDPDWNPITRCVETKIPQWDIGKMPHDGIGYIPVTDTSKWLAPKKEKPREN